MPTALTLPPLSLYVHIPWCVRKCPYCDFNSHAAPQELPIDAYLACLKQDLLADLDLVQGRKIHSVFFGGGTPSLFPGVAIGDLLAFVADKIGFETGAEITLEANPGTAERGNFTSLRMEGVNRLSLGVQSFNDDHLQRLGRIHGRDEALNAFQLARDAGFNNINIDLMHGLPEQTPEQGLSDLQQAISLGPEHISWYQLTIEPNTHFYSHTPILPLEDTLESIQEQGHATLEAAGYNRYETSAYAKQTKRSAHNINYWQFGDYLAIGAGAHGKNTTITPAGLQVSRNQKTRLPKDYLAASANNTGSNPFCTKQTAIAPEQLPLEFMMNALRLMDGVSASTYFARTGQPLNTLAATLADLRKQGLMVDNDDILTNTEVGHRYLNSVLERFL